MKTEKYYLVLAVVTGILCVPAFGQIEFYPSAEEPTHGPVLTEIKLVEVSIIPPDIVLKKDALDPEELKLKVQRKLKKAAVNVFIPKKGVKYKLPVLSRLNVRMEMFKLTDSKEYICRIQTSLSRVVNLKVKRSVMLRTDVWKTKPTIQIVSLEDISAKVTDVVLEQTETFIAAYLAANPKGSEPVDANDIVTALPKLVKPVAKSTPAKYKYVASKNSKVFHKPDCVWAKRIKPENLIGYNSRAEALKAGKRPCKRCKP